MRRPALATLVLFLLALLFGWETRQALRATPGVPDNVATPPGRSWVPGVSAPDPNSPPDPMPAAMAVAARPLFRQDRQPFREQAAGASVRNYEAELSRFTLLGVLGFGAEPVGVVAGKAGGKGERWEVKRGDSLQGFAVREVGMEGLRLTADGQEFLLPLYAGAPTAAVGAVRTEATPRNAAKPSGSPNVAGPPPGPGAVPRPAIPAASPLTRRLRQLPSAPMAPQESPAPLPSNAPPAAAPRNIPGAQ